ncbi:MAG: class I SAM-dependent methyltransferase [Proteobacteria bacterium]|nr:class I SAM-dependent methyltransferase [Pseudomonadota bacterium]
MAPAARAWPSPELAGVDDYYSGKIREHGPTPLGVDWSCVPTQEMRFVQLLKVCDFDSDFSLNDVGCGYGALLQYLNRKYRKRRIDYLGTDLSQPMVAAARRKWQGRAAAEFQVSCNAARLADYSVASGVFNVRLDAGEQAWELLVAETLASMRASSRRGFAVNFLHPPAHERARIAQLYYPQPERWISHCQQHLGMDVELLGGYGMREYTLLMRPRG